MESLISTFHIDWKLMVAQIINFVLVFCALYLIAAKPLRNLIKERSEEIHIGLLNAKENESLLEKTKKEYEGVILAAKKEANEILQLTKQEADAKKVEMFHQAKKDVENLIENGKKSLEVEKQKMLSDTKKEIVDLVVQTTAKVINHKLDASVSNEIARDLDKIN